VVVLAVVVLVQIQLLVLAVLEHLGKAMLVEMDTRQVLLVVLVAVAVLVLLVQMERLVVAVAVAQGYAQPLLVKEFSTLAVVVAE
jgi:hypothetical protein